MRNQLRVENKATNWLGASSLLVIAVLTKAAMGQSSEDPNAVPVTRQVTIVTLGDSITRGTRGGVSVEQTFPALLQSQLGDNGISVRIINVGFGGERTDQASKRIGQILEHDPDIVTVMYGTNDSYVDSGQTTSRITLGEYRSNLERIVVDLLRRGVVPVLMTEPRWADDAPANGVGENPNKRLEPFVVACREVAHAWRVPLVDHFARWTNCRAEGVNIRDWTTDGCHPNQTGHRELAAAIVPVMERVIGPDLGIRQRLFRGSLRDPDTAVKAYPATIRIICFGDSVTGVYYHTGSRRAYTDMLEIAVRRVAPHVRLELINAGISGHTTADALARIDSDVLRLKPDLVTVMFGLNDMSRVPLEKYRENLREIVRRCRAVDSEVVLATPNNILESDARPAEKLVQYCDVVREVGRELNAPVCDVYRELAAVRAQDPLGWKLLMSDAIHPNMDGHKRLAIALAQTITRHRVTLDDVSPPPALRRTIESLRVKKPVHILAMKPYDEWIGPALREAYPDAIVRVDPWPAENSSMAEIAHDARTRVRGLKPDLVLIAIPPTANAENDETFASSFGWIMNWSISFGPPTWDCIVVHPSVTDPASNRDSRAELIRRLVRTHDLSLVDRLSGNQADAQDIFREWIHRSAKE